MRILNRTTLTHALLAISACTFLGCSTRGTPDSSHNDHSEPVVKSEASVLEIKEQARKNLQLTVKAARPTEYWRSITIPGIIVDRPGVSDRGVTSPAVGVVSEIHVYPGDTIRPGQRVVTLKLFSEYLQATQTQLFKAAQEVKLLQDQLDRLSAAVNSGAVSNSRAIELRNEYQRQQILIQASKQELLNRGLNPDQIAAVFEGNFVSMIDVYAPPPRANTVSLDGLEKSPFQTVGFQTLSELAYEVQSLGVELGQTVQAGDLLASLANHQVLYVVGHAFKREATLIEQAAQNKIPVQIEFAEDTTDSWPSLQQEFQIRHLSNTIDRESRTFDFFVPLVNQSRSYERDGNTFMVWRFRPGQRTRIEVPVERFENVYLLPTEAVVRDGPNAFVYRQNGDLFNQIAVHVLHEDRNHIVVANDGSITAGSYLAQNAAASLRRILKSQSANGEQPGMHVHADGTVHAAH